MALSDFTIVLPGLGLRTFSQKQVGLTDNNLTTLVTGAAGKRTEIYALIVSSDTASSFTLQSGANTLAVLHVNGNAGVKYASEGVMPMVVAESGENVIIQAGVSSLSASVTIVYRQVET